VTLLDYLAHLRVVEARRMLADPACDRFTIDAIAGDSGFGSRSAFYKIFGRLTGLTPTAFRQRTRSPRPSQGPLAVDNVRAHRQESR
jgi:putative ABC transport system permease protein